MADDGNAAATDDGDDTEDDADIDDGSDDEAASLVEDRASAALSSLSLARKDGSATMKSPQALQKYFRQKPSSVV